MLLSRLRNSQLITGLYKSLRTVFFFIWFLFKRCVSRMLSTVVHYFRFFRIVVFVWIDLWKAKQCRKNDHEMIFSTEKHKKIRPKKVIPNKNNEQLQWKNWNLVDRVRFSQSIQCWWWNVSSSLVSDDDDDDEDDEMDEQAAKDLEGFIAEPGDEV